MEERTKNQRKEFKVGDHVWSPHFGEGVVVDITNDPEDPYPVKVHWVGAVSRSLPEDDYFTKDGQYDYTGSHPDMAIYSREESEFIKLSDLLGDSDTVDRMMDAQHKKTEDAINPAHYQVEGIPEAYDIMTHLMNREQLEGFLWGNIIKYTYRYGRKGDKAETAGKIKWYAQKLKELGECESK